MIPSRISPTPIVQPLLPPTSVVDDVALPWIDQLNQSVLLTVQALQRLHTAFNQKFTRSPSNP